MEIILNWYTVLYFTNVFFFFLTDRWWAEVLLKCVMGGAPDVWMVFLMMQLS